MEFAEEASKIEVRLMSSADDRILISRVYEASWKYAYKGIIAQDFLDSIPEGSWVSGIDNPDWHTLICLDNGKTIGTSSFCKSRSEQFSDWGEIISVYLLPGYMGKGCGKALLRAALTELKKLGYANVFLWVLEENTRARLFYEHFGFMQTDDFFYDNIGGKTLREIRYVYENR